MKGLAACLAILLAWPAMAGAQGSATAPTQDAPPPPRFEIYGFAQADFGYDFRQNDPDWFDVNRPTKLPSFADAFGRDGRMFAGARQSRLGVHAALPTESGDVKATFEFDMFGVGADAGQTTIRLRLAYGEFGDFGAGQLWSPFMDADVFPNSLDYWGPNGMLFFRNVLAFWQPIKGDTRLTIAAERPGASGDAGEYADRVAIENVQLRFPVPDLSAEYRLGRSWGYLEGAGIVRYIKYDDTLDDRFDLSGDAVGWGLSASSNIRPTAADVLRLQLVYGHGIQNYFNDAPVDLAVETDFSHPSAPLRGKALPVLGMTTFLDHTWSDRWSSSVGYSRLDIDNSDGQMPDAFRRGQYALGNLLHYPARNVMVGGEVQWARRTNFGDGFAVNDIRVQVSFKFSFSQQIGGTP